ncbi:phosphate/phosphite/phosphonate ABC transporter substrate-binding protein [Chitinimonas sp.]|uniref:phosphate/phosphite/phosphonate ABC transporter substrate-binding protein n=1 Tax=Chitinimonas sp. TaxID=1934313 RepID=UPI002F92F0FF
MLRCLCLLAILAIGPLLHAESPDLRIGLEPYFTPRLLISGFQPLQAAMEKSLGRPVVLLTAPDYRQFVRRIENHDFDIVVIGPHTARYAEEQAGYVPVLIGRSSLVGLVVVRREAGPRQVGDLGDATIALPDPLTATAMLGEEWLRKQGLRVSLRYYDFHNAAAMAVVRGDAQAAIVNKTAFANMPGDIRDGLRVLAETRSLPHMVVLVGGDVDPALRKRYTDSLAGFVNSREHGESFAGRVGFAGADAIKPGELAPVEPFYLELKRRLKAE